MNEGINRPDEEGEVESANSDLIKTIWEQCRNGQYESALATLHKALKQSPKSLQLHLELAKVYDDQKNSEKTIEYCAKALKIAPANSMACALMGSAYTRRHQLGKAVSSLLKALTLDPDNEYSYELLGRLALTATMSVVERTPEYIGASISVFGGPTVEIHRIQPAIQYYQQGCTEKWQYLRAYFRFGMMYYHADNPEKLHERIAATAQRGYGPAQEWLKEISESTEGGELS
ncbi:MAG: tetratricopeptide repeat protein [Sedimentisphaerales bacterium]|nr:tetratricopeptide repeat protein [Sedimentisphaerales bacterium]